MSCDENSFKDNKQTSSSELRTKLVYFMHRSSILVAWINDGRSSFLLWSRLRLLVVFGEGIWGNSRCNSALDFFSLLWNSRDCTMHAQLFNATLHDFKGFQLVSIAVFLWPRRRTLYSGPCQVLAAPFVSRYFQDVRTGTSLGGRSFIYGFS